MLENIKKIAFFHNKKITRFFNKISFFHSFYSHRRLEIDSLVAIFRAASDEYIFKCI